MELILDSTVLVGAERRGLNARQTFTQVMERLGSSEVGISVVTVLEFTHGVVRADHPSSEASRRWLGVRGMYRR
jgi:predicted nucleic acid-binding protein